MQLVAPYYQPLWVANVLASLDTLSGGRVLTSFGVGWSKEEFDAMGADFSNRGARVEEMIAIIRRAWTEDYVPQKTAHYDLPAVKIAPKPVHPIPIWVAGTSERAYRRAVELGDGYHGHAVQDITVENVADRVARVRRDRPEDSFTFSVYTWEWDLARRSEDEIMAEHAGVRVGRRAARGHRARHRRPRDPSDQHPSARGAVRHHPALIRQPQYGRITGNQGWSRRSPRCRPVSRIQGW